MGRPKPRKPTRDEKKLISAAGLIARNWHVLDDQEDKLHLINKGTGRSRYIKKGA